MGAMTDLFTLRKKAREVMMDEHPELSRNANQADLYITALVKEWLEQYSEKVLLDVVTGLPVVKDGKVVLMEEPGNE